MPNASNASARGLPVLPHVIIYQCLRAVDEFPATADRIETLSSACLVSRQWLSVARALLYGRVYLCLAEPPTHGTHSSALLTTLLAHRRLAEMAEELALHLENATPVGAAAAFTLFGDLKNVRRFGISVSKSKSAVAAPHLHKLRRLRHLSINGEYSATFLRAVYSLSRLRSLHFSATGMVPDLTFQPLWTLQRFRSDIDMPASFFYKMTLFTIPTLTQLVLALSEEHEPLDLSFLSSLSDLAFIRAKPRMTSVIFKDGTAERATYMLAVLRSARDLPHLKRLALANSLTEPGPLWAELETCSAEFFNLLPHALENLNIVACDDAFDPETLTLALERREQINPTLRTIFVSFEAWMTLLHSGLIDNLDLLPRVGTKILPWPTYPVTPEAASCFLADACKL